MRKLAKILGALFALLFIIGAILFFVGYFQKGGAGISIETTPSATVFINNEQVGSTPYEAIREPGEVTIKLVPDSFEKPLAPYETKINLVSDVQTVINLEFGETQGLGNGAILSFENVDNTETSIAVISTPDASEVSIDGTVRGFTPFKTNSITSGSHQLVITAPGYKQKALTVATQLGYKLTAQVNLSPSDEVVLAEETKEPEEVEEPKQMVEILNTGTGFLRVRSGPSTLESEVGQVVPAKSYLFVEKDEVSGWFKIEYEEGKEGWVTNQYAKLITATPSPSPTPSPSSSPKVN